MYLYKQGREMKFQQLLIQLSFSLENKTGNEFFEIKNSALQTAFNVMRRKVICASAEGKISATS